MAHSRKILCAAALAATAALLLPAAASAGRRQEIVSADLFQAGRQLVFTVRTAKPVSLGKLAARPDARRASSRYLCLALGKPSGAGLERRLCLGGRHAHRRVGIELADEEHAPSRQTSVRASVKRPSPRKLVVAFDPAAAGIHPGRWGWRALESHGCELRRKCARALPAQGRRGFRLRPVRAIGCSGGDAGLVSAGPRERPVVALTFDDGPSEYTPGFLQVLREKDAVGTFFEVGQEMPGREEVMREILAQGSELADHTMNHVELPSYAQIAGAASLIDEYTHFRPCLFRPPGGAVNSSVVGTAGALGMQTITWDVDPSDWQNPGSGAVYSRVVGAARPGSIILMHDGGGPRGGTLAALPRIIDTLRGRGYRFATVSELLGHRLIYRPYG